ncbi:uncharacterized protein LOC129743066 [Uranotaenia lowii]|uniref:uncharacterized protein LOC129743066 n=1 Tax=Uranotaenia lowii TaxID=190385 RepID=UPI002478A02F|nr:uncharacterized protein LOC129743066 [Uranotaenia lowii]
MEKAMKCSWWEKLCVSPGRKPRGSVPRGSKPKPLHGEKPGQTTCSHCGPFEDGEGIKPKKAPAGNPDPGEAKKERQKGRTGRRPFFPHLLFAPSTVPYLPSLLGPQWQTPRVDQRHRCSRRRATEKENLHQQCCSSSVLQGGRILKKSTTSGSQSVLPVSSKQEVSRRSSTRASRLSFRAKSGRKRGKKQPPGRPQEAPQV